MSPYQITAKKFPALLEKELVRLTDLGWTREDLAGMLGYSARQMQNWRSAPPPRALQVGVLTCLSAIIGTPEPIPTP